MRRAGSVKWIAVLVTAGGVAGWAQNTMPAASGIDHANAYYHYTLAHMYAELAGTNANRGEYVTQAIDNYKQAIKADPSASVLAEELSDLYIQSGRLREAQDDAEAALKLNPNDVSARRMLARIYLRQISQRNNRVDEAMLRRAIEQFQKIAELDPKDSDAWLMLGRLQRASSNSAESEKAYKKVLEIDPDNEDALTGLSQVYADLGDNKSAADLLKKAADRRPSATSLTALASAYESVREFDLAAEALRKALDLDPPNADEIKRELAQDLIASEKFQEALDIYKDMTTADPGDAQGWLRMAQVYLAMHDTAKAREASEKARTIEPNSIEIRYNSVNILQAEGRTTEAIAALKEILTLTEKKTYNANERDTRVRLLERLGLMQREGDQIEASADTFRQMIALDPDKSGPRASAQLVETYRQGKQYAKAQQEADAAEKKWPMDRSLRVVRASVQAEMGKVDAAASDVKKMLNGKEDRETYLVLADIYDKGRKWDEVAKNLDQAEKLSTTAEDKETIWFKRGAMFERMKNADAAEREFRKVLASSPDNTGALNYLSYMFADRNMKLPEALTLINKALEAEPTNGAYLDTLGWLYFRMGKLAEAETTLTQALDKVPHDPTMRDHLAQVLFQRAKLKEAVTQWEASLKEWQTSSPADTDQAEISKVKSRLDTARTRLANAK